MDNNIKYDWLKVTVDTSCLSKNGKRNVISCGNLKDRILKIKPFHNKNEIRVFEKYWVGRFLSEVFLFRKNAQGEWKLQGESHVCAGRKALEEEVNKRMNG